MTRTNGCTIEEFAEATGTAAPFLEEVGVTEVRRKQHRAVRLSDAVTYLKPPAQGGTIADDAVERRADTSTLFGLDLLGLIAEAGSVYLVADEIEALTLRFHGLPALVVPPVACWADGGRRWRRPRSSTSPSPTPTSPLRRQPGSPTRRSATAFALCG